MPLYVFAEPVTVIVSPSLYAVSGLLIVTSKVGRTYSSTVILAEYWLSAVMRNVPFFTFSGITKSVVATPKESVLTLALLISLPFVSLSATLIFLFATVFVVSRPISL